MFMRGEEIHESLHICNATFWGAMTFFNVENGVIGIITFKKYVRF
jgi:hypothetical protein